MRIQVDCRKRKGGTEPRSFLLGSHRLWVSRVLERDANTASRRFVVRTTDGRRFALRENLTTGYWELAGIAPAGRPA